MGAAEKWEAPAIDLEQARAFLALLGSGFTFQTFGEAGNKRSLTRVLHGDFAQHAATLARLNQQGAGVFVMVNAGDGKARKSGNVQTVRAVFADLDGAPLAPVHAASLAPHIVVESSPGRWHAYWLASGVPLEQFKPLQQAIALRLASDPKVCDLPRVMRLPGFLHNKHAPYQTHIVEQHATAPYPYAAIVAWLGFGEASNQVPIIANIAHARTLADKIPEGERNSTLFALARGLVNRGVPAQGVNDRIQRINADRCQPPLDARDVDTIATRASDYGSQGWRPLTDALQDSPEWQALPAESCVIVLAYYRRFDGFNNGRLCVTWKDDFEGRHNINSSGRFDKYRRIAVTAGFLIEASRPRNSQRGRVPAKYAMPEKYLAQVPKQSMGPSAKTEYLNR